MYHPPAAPSGVSHCLILSFWCPSLSLLVPPSHPSASGPALVVKCRTPSSEHHGSSQSSTVEPRCTQHVLRLPVGLWLAVRGPSSPVQMPAISRMCPATLRTGKPQTTGHLMHMNHTVPPPSGPFPSLGAASVLLPRAPGLKRREVRLPAPSHFPHCARI